jgi:hypothetical protein
MLTEGEELAQHGTELLELKILADPDQLDDLLSGG